MKYIGFKEPRNHWSIEDKHSNLRSTDHVTMPIYKSVSIDSLIVKVCALYKKSIVQPSPIPAAGDRVGADAGAGAGLPVRGADQLRPAARVEPGRDDAPRRRGHQGNTGYSRISIGPTDRRLQSSRHLFFIFTVTAL